MKNISSKKVVIAMSGGVDSSVAALVLKQQGYDITGVLLRTWTEPEKECLNSCCTPESMAAARNVAAILNIPFYVIDARDIFHTEIVDFFIDGYRRGITPNPCVRCNQVIRWGYLLEEAHNMGASHLATGHYARIVFGDTGSVILKKGLDEGKDQSYVLSGLSPEQLRCTILPIGEMKKSEVREIARQSGLTTAEKKDSQDLCFLAGDDYRHFLRRNAADIFKSGEILDTSGRTIGRHNGLPDFTIGQRKGLGAIQEPYYVIHKDIEKNVLIAGKAEELGANACFVENMNWITDPDTIAFNSIQVKIRYKAPAVPATIELPGNGSVCVKFNRDLRDITPGQQAAFYDKDNCLGGGQISQVFSL
ncbi:MAG: tRNA 2-thiouridine(34) synthase MnmA [Leptolinea sp.]|jgi:tRNA-specific 2-thiouridylase|nr:tRNA 2-thiouridine(34) synthase MnmA [Leptolinea sp.]